MHTPGPYKFHIGRGKNPRFHVQTEAGYQIANTPEISRHKPEADQQLATVRLLTAAPELLASLERLVESIHVPDDGLEGEELYAYEQARAAIAKAKGVQS